MRFEDGHRRAMHQHHHGGGPTRPRQGLDHNGCVTETLPTPAHVCRRRQTENACAGQSGDTGSWEASFMVDRSRRWAANIFDDALQRADVLPQ
jgi:hypothetical protein